MFFEKGVKKIKEEQKSHYCFQKKHVNILRHNKTFVEN